MNIYYIIHQEALCGEILTWKEVMSVAIYSIYFIQKNGLGHFQEFLDESEPEQ